MTQCSVVTWRYPVGDWFCPLCVEAGIAEPGMGLAARAAERANPPAAAAAAAASAGDADDAEVEEDPAAPVPEEEEEEEEAEEEEEDDEEAEDEEEHVTRSRPTKRRRSELESGSTMPDVFDSDVEDDDGEALARRDDRLRDGVCSAGDDVDMEDDEDVQPTQSSSPPPRCSLPCSPTPRSPTPPTLQKKKAGKPAPSPKPGPRAGSSHCSLIVYPYALAAVSWGGCCKCVRVHWNTMSKR
jgi:hypothetical protein